MYVPQVFQESDPEILRTLICSVSLCQFVTATAAGPIATPLPMMLDASEGEQGVLYGHFARQNPQWREAVIGDALAIFMGVDSYITPDWYASKQQHGMVVPTWNYEAVQAFGPAEFFEDQARLLDVVTRITDLHETPRANRWRVSDAPAPFIEGQLKGIVGVRMPITRLIGKRKLSQNRNAADRDGVAQGLAESGCPMQQRMAGLISAA